MKTRELSSMRARILAAVGAAAASIVVAASGACNDVDAVDDGDGPVPSLVALSSSQCQTCLIKAGKMTCWGDGFGEDVTGGTPREVSLPGYPILMATAPDHVCALVRDKGVYCWGSNDAGQLGVAIPEPDPAAVLKQPQKSGLPSIATALSAGSGFTCALVSGSVKCMGGSISGTLGNGDFSKSVEPVTVPGLTTITQIGSGFAHTCALDSAGDTYCWGSNDNGQCGQDKNEQTIDHAQQVQIPKATRLMIGWETSCAVTSDGTYCWGRNNSNQFADMGPNDGAPRKVPLDAYIDVKPGASRVFGLRQEGTVDFWGLDLSKMSAEAVAPTPIHGVNNLAAISGGSNHGCGITGGQVFCWGDNTCHQLGGAPGDLSAIPVRVL